MQPGVAAGLRLGFLRSPPLPSTIASLNPLKELTEKLSSARAVLLPAQIRPVYPMGRRRGIDVTEDKRGSVGREPSVPIRKSLFLLGQWVAPPPRQTHCLGEEAPLVPE